MSTENLRVVVAQRLLSAGQAAVQRCDDALAGLLFALAGVGLTSASNPRETVAGALFDMVRDQIDEQRRTVVRGHRPAEEPSGH